MKVYQENKDFVNGSVEITNSELLFAKARDGLLELSLSAGCSARPVGLSFAPMPTGR